MDYHIKTGDPPHTVVLFIPYHMVILILNQKAHGRRPLYTIILSRNRKNCGFILVYLHLIKSSMDILVVKYKPLSGAVRRTRSARPYVVPQTGHQG